MGGERAGGANSKWGQTGEIRVRSRLIAILWVLLEPVGFSSTKYA